MKKYKIRPYLAAALALVMVLCMMLVTGCSGESGGSDPVETGEVAVNPLTGQTSEEGFDENALNQRVAAFVVENSPESRPQWGMDDAEYSPDIVLQGEVDAGITRTLWMYADYNKLPEIIGPMRSARPPYIRFSELFDAVFIHWGQSSSKGNYVGADTVFKKDGVDHINQMSFDESIGLFDRDHTRNVSMEHTGILYGAKVPEALQHAGFRTEPEEYTRLDFSPATLLDSIVPAEQIRVNYSDVAAWDRTTWTYNKDDQKYHTANFQNDFSRDNLLVLLDDTEYVDKQNYKGEIGSTVTYCDYALGGGKGYLLTHGTCKDIEWRVEDGKLVLIDVKATKIAQDRAAQAAEDAESSDSEEESGPVEVRAALYPGKTWIGWASANNGGSMEILSGEEE